MQISKAWTQQHASMLLRQTLRCCHIPTHQLQQANQ
jgi:hypothetical protein